MTLRWGHAENDVVDVDEFDVGVEICDECCAELFEPEARFEDGDPFCSECWADLFGEDN